MKIPYCIIVFILIVILCNCKSNKKPQEISDEIVLKIGKAEITKYEFEQFKQLKNMANSDNKANQEALYGLINNYFIVADALDKKYDTISEIKKMVDYQMKTMIGRRQGYLWNKIEEPKLQFSNSDIKEAYKKRNTIYYLEYLKFQDRNILLKTLTKDTIIKSENEFTSIITKCKQDKKIEYLNQAFLWPFDQLSPFKDIIEIINDGEITRPLNSYDGIYYVHLIKKETTSQPPIKIEKGKILNALKMAKTKEIIAEKRYEIKCKAQTSYNETNINNLYKLLESNSFNKNIKVDPKHSNDLILSYNLNNTRVDLKISEFADYYKFNFTVSQISDKESLMQLLDDFIEEKLLYVEAGEAGILNDKQFLIDKQNLLNQMIERNYFRKEIEIHANVTLKEKEDYYNKNRTSFTTGKECTVTFLTFKDKNSAEGNFGTINSIVRNGELYNLSDTNIIKGLVSYQPNIKIDINNKTYPEYILQGIFSIGLNIPYMPTEFKSKYIVFFKTKEEGKRVQKLEEVDMVIFSQLMKIKLDSLKNTRVNELKKKYTVEINKIEKLD